MLLLVALLVFVAIALVGFAVAAWLTERQRTRIAVTRRLDRIAGGRADVRASVLRDQRLSRIAFLNALLGRTPLVLSMVRVVRQAGIKRRVGEVLLYVPLLACTALLLSLLFGASVLVGLGLAIVAGATPLLIVLRLRGTRTRKFAEQLADALDLIRSALQAGHGLPGAMGVAAETFPEPISYEMLYAVEEMRLGLPLRDSLYHMNERVPDSNLNLLAVGVLVASESGGNLAEVMDNLAHTIRERFKMLRELRVLTAQGRMSGLVLTSLPFIVGGMLFAFNPTYFQPMFESRTGKYLLAYAFGSLLWGHLVIRRLVRLEG
jgi:tight adherence protein B